ncbi:alpha,alpha-trehalose phosphorylase [Kineothrix alysoides]|uniref:Alpha,alpha-trehalose phosphorylase n=1 Tax=Kineothrix alysoides TaxID=1469948 RepID=A0A4R1QX09_9FIRM|nr:glycosyl hydrolase family 65 protein [Kineothrix alysoides]TCL57575.1 alpha,alpha-trehalose phosphorylase [Kineothrix alysoides]
MEKMIYEIRGLSNQNDDLLLNETIFHTSNGYVGVRANYEEGYPQGYDTIRGTYINGFYDIAEMKQAEKLYGFIEEKQTILNVADSQGVKLLVDGEEFSMFTGTVLESRRWLNMLEGYAGRKVIWRSPKGKEIEILIKRMTSFFQKSLFTIEYMVKALNFTGKIEFISFHNGEVMNYSNPEDPRVASESVKNLYPFDVRIAQEASYIKARTARSGLSVCTGVKNILTGEGPLFREAVSEIDVNGFLVIHSLKADIEKERTVTLTKYTVFSDSIRCEDVELHARKEMAKAVSVNLAAWYERQKDYLEEYWDNCDLEIYGDDDLCLAVRFNLYQLIQSVGKDRYSNITAKGLSGEGYEGHYFWDTEMYIQPFFILTNPDIAKNLIEYRYGTMEGARENARILGHNRGVLYPWRTIMGKECSGYFPSGSAQYHINGDIAHSIVAYYLATKDLEFIAQKGAEIIFETARLWLDVGNYHKGNFYINDVTGPDEYTCVVNNNYYTNVSAQYNMRWASRFYYLLKENGAVDKVANKLQMTEAEIKEMETAAECMYLPYDEEYGINPQDDSFLSKARWNIGNTPKEKFPLLLHYHPLYLYRHQVCKQADTVMAHFIFEDAQSIETIQKSFEYYEKITTHDSSLSTCIYSIVASKLGMKEKAYNYLGNSAKLDLFNIHKNTRDGIHTANMGGNYMAIVYGFAGLRLKEEGLFLAPLLPEQWEGYRFKIKYEGSKIMVQVKRGTSTFSLLSGEAKQIWIYGKEYLLQDTIILTEEVER